MLPSPDPELARLRAAARAIFTRSIDTCSIEAAFARHVHSEGCVLTVAPPGGDHPAFSVDLSACDQVQVLSIGKAAAPMLEALLRRLPPTLPIEALCVAPEKHLPPRRPHLRLTSYAGGHPSPNSDSFRAAAHALELLRGATARTFVVFLLSGGGSALFDLPLDPSIPLSETVAFHRALVGSGAAIAEINALRKHFSAVKGGRLAAAAGAARSLTLQVADVPETHLDALASAPTVADSTTVADCRAILTRYDMAERLPPAVRAYFARPDLPETPKPAGDSNRQAAPVITLLSNADLLRSAAAEASRLGFHTVVDNGCDDWDYAEAGEYLLRRFAGLPSGLGPVCLLSGGEVTVRLEGSPGQGGRNQQLALWCALALEAPVGNASPLLVLSAGSDGIDGASPAAGATADRTTAGRVRRAGFDPESALRHFDSYPLFHALGDDVRTGPTGNNLRDLRLLMGFR